MSAYIRMRRVATALLVCAFALFLVAKYVGNDQGIWGYIRAFSEAAMVGAIADWFAVTALFRRPLGLPIPHTAIIPRKKAALGRSLGLFISEHFLTTAQLMPKLRQYDPIRRVAHWLSLPTNVQSLSSYAILLLQQSIGTLRDQRAADFLHHTVVQQLKTVNTPKLVGQLFAQLTAEGRHQAVLDMLLKWLARALQSPSLQQRVATAISQELRGTLYLKSLTKAAGGWSTEKLVSALTRELEAVAADPNHELRQRFEAYMRLFIRRLEFDSSFQTQLLNLQQQLLSEPIVRRYVYSIWRDAVDYVESDLHNSNSSLRQKLGSATLAFARQLLHDTNAQNLFSEKLYSAFPYWLDKYRYRVALYIEERIANWDTDELVSQLEHSIGKDLQFIRINGTVVGGLVGLSIHFVTHVLI